MRQIIFIALTLSMVVPSITSASISVVAEPFARISISGDTADFIAQIGYEARGISRVLIRCVDGCKKPISYVDHIDCVPISVSVAGDLSPTLLVTTWGSGSAYRVFVYSVQDMGVSRVLSQYSWAVPFFGVNDHHRYVVVTQGQSRFEQHWITYYWRGNRFVRRRGYPTARGPSPVRLATSLMKRGASSEISHCASKATASNISSSQTRSVLAKSPKT